MIRATKEEKLDPCTTATHTEGNPISGKYPWLTVSDLWKIYSFKEKLEHDEFFIELVLGKPFEDLKRERTERKLP